MRLNGVEIGVEIDGRGPPLVLLHGFTGSSHAWDHLLPYLRESATLIRVDALGHGQSESPADPARYTFDHASRDLVALLDILDLAQVDLLGYSMGGRLALHCAVHYPHRLRTLVLESASAGIADETERARRVASDEALAQRLEHNGVEGFVAEWERTPLLQLGRHVSEEVRATQHRQRLTNNPRGLANSLRGLGAGVQTPLWPRLPELELPVQLIVGQDDQRYIALAEQARGLLPNARLDVVPNAGHTVHLDQPAGFAGLVVRAVTGN